MTVTLKATAAGTVAHVMVSTTRTLCGDNHEDLREPRRNMRLCGHCANKMLDGRWA